MHSSRSKRINKTILPNQALKGSTYTNSSLNFFYQIKKPEQQTLSSRVQYHNRTISHLDRQTSKAEQTNNRQKSYSKRQQKTILPIPCFNKSSEKPVRVLTKRVVKDEVDFELGNLNKVISGTPLGALSARELIQKLEDGKIKVDVNTPQPLQRPSKQEEPDQMGFSTLYQTNLVVPPFIAKSSTQRERTRRRSSINSSNSSINNKILGFIYGGQDFLTQYREHQQSVLEKVVHYRQRRLKVDYKSQWKV